MGSSRCRRPGGRAAWLLAAAALAGCTNPLRSIDRVLMPPERVEDERVGSGLRFWPVLERTRGRNYVTWDVLWPLLSHERVGAYRSTSAIWPLVRHEALGRRWTLQIRPLYWSASDPESGRGYALGIPLYWDLWNPRGRTTVGVPLFYAHRVGQRRATVLFPLWWDFDAPGSRFWLAFPFVGAHATGAGRTTAVLPPLYFRHADAEGRHVQHWLLGPLAHYRAAPEAHFGYIFPLAWHRWAAERGFTVVFPLWWQFDRAGGSRTQIGFPLWWGFRFGPQRATTIGFPLWWDFTYAENDYDRILFPFWWDFRAPTRRTVAVLPPIFARWTGPEGSETRILWRLFEDVRTTEKRLVAFNPLFAYESNRRGDFSWSILGWLYRYSREGGRSRHRIFWFLEF